MRLVFILCLCVSLQAADPILRQRFAADPEGWLATGSGTVEASGGALDFRYESGAMALPVGDLPLQEMKSLRFEIRTDGPFALAIAMGQQKPGASWTAFFWSNGQAWQPVVLTPRDFTPLVSGGSMPGIVYISLLDFSQYLAEHIAEARVYTEPHKGAHQISIRNFEILREAPEQVGHPQSEWVGAGGATFEKAADGVTIRYARKGELWSAFTRAEPLASVEKALHLELDVQSEHDAQLAISIEDGTGRHNIDFAVAAGTKPEHREVLLEAFQPGGLNPATLKSISILDVTGEPGINELRLANLRFR